MCAGSQHARCACSEGTHPRARLAPAAPAPARMLTGMGYCAPAAHPGQDSMSARRQSSALDGASSLALSRSDVYPHMARCYAMQSLLRTQHLLLQASSKKAAPHAKPAGAPVFKGVTWSSSNGQWRAQAWDGKKVCSVES